MPRHIHRFPGRDKCKNFIREHGQYKYPDTAATAREKGKNAPELPEKMVDLASELHQKRVACREALCLLLEMRPRQTDLI